MMDEQLKEKFTTWGATVSVYINFHVDPSFGEQSHLFVC